MLKTRPNPKHQKSWPDEPLLISWSSKNGSYFENQTLGPSQSNPFMAPKICRISWPTAPKTKIKSTPHSTETSSKMWGWKGGRKMADGLSKFEVNPFFVVGQPRKKVVRLLSRGERYVFLGPKGIIHIYTIHALHNNFPLASQKQWQDFSSMNPFVVQFWSSTMWCNMLGYSLIWQDMQGYAKIC